MIIERKKYAEKIIPEISKLILKYWDHEGINLHSRDIRKAIGPFSFMLDQSKRNDFYNDINNFMNDMPYILFITCISKDKHFKQYKENAHNPYEIAFKMTMERILHFLNDNHETELPIIAEARGKNEDDQLN